MANHSAVSKFELVGFPGLPQKFHVLVSVVMLFVYIASLIANIMVIVLTTTKRKLHHPMYKLIANLALSDLLFDTITLPKIISKYWYGDGSISVPACLTQLFFVHCLGSLDSFTLALMGFDRYVAICKPLRYTSIVTNRLTVLLCWAAWVLAAAVTSYNTYSTTQFYFCDDNKVRSNFCVSFVLYALVCSDFSTVQQVSFIIAMFVLLVPLSFVILSYIVIIKTIYSSSRSESWQKAFYTCSSHLFVISLYYVPRLAVYFCSVFRVAVDADINILILCLYTYVPHVASPVVYCLRTEEIKTTLRLCISRKA